MQIKFIHKIVVCFAVFVSFIILFCCPYMPVMADNNQRLYYVDHKLTLNQVQQTCDVLETYNEFYFRIGNKIFIPIWLFCDKDLLFNYTWKSSIFEE